MFSIFIHKARSFARRPLFEQAWFIPVWLLLGASRLLIHIVPFRSLAPHLGKHVGSAPWVPLLDARHTITARSIRRVVEMAAKYTFWKSNCFPQAVAARVLLGLYGIPYAIFFGISRETDETAMQAHAWVVSGRIHVCGGKGFERFTVVGCFVAPWLGRQMKRS
ncbi:MAG TPA: lasso peptide biosynthesis B2 protein [Gallionella sp.]|nr:lasso peptide biosynthesis B2 protein [Gallionella sp.]